MAAALCTQMLPTPALPSIHAVAVCVLQTTAKASEFASELNAYRETEGAIATALATASVEDLPEAAACAAAATAGTAAGTESSADGTPAWLEAEARAGGEARSRSLKVQVLALRRALFKVARRAVKRGASEEQVGGDIDEAVGSVPSPPSQTPATAATSADTAGVDASGAAGDAVAPAPTTSLDRYRRALGVTSAPVLRADAAAALGQAGVDGGIAGQSGMPASADSEVVEPPAPIDHAVRGEAAVGSFSPSGAAAGGGGAEHVEPTEAGGEVTVGLLGFLLAPPIAIADALAAASEAVFGTDEEEDSKAGSDAGPVAVRTPL